MWNWSWRSEWSKNIMQSSIEICGIHHSWHHFFMPNWHRHQYIKPDLTPAMTLSGFMSQHWTPKAKQIQQEIPALYTTGMNSFWNWHKYENMEHLYLSNFARSYQVWKYKYQFGFLCDCHTWTNTWYIVAVSHLPLIGLQAQWLWNISTWAISEMIGLARNDKVK